MAKRKIVLFDHDKCNGCGQCVSACAEAAIQIVNGKAQLMRDDFCDGLGACIGECPMDAITIIEREAPAFDEGAVHEHIKSLSEKHSAPVVHTGCPGSQQRQFSRENDSPAASGKVASALRQWPVQLHLVSPNAPYFKDADLLLAADCAAFSFGDLHRSFLTDHALAIACPKLDQGDGYVEKLAEIIKGGLRSVTVLMMEVPCCGGLERMLMQAMKIAEVSIPLRRVIIGIQSEVLSDETVI